MNLKEILRDSDCDFLQNSGKKKKTWLSQQNVRLIPKQDS